MGRQGSLTTPWLTERHGYDPTYGTMNDKALEFEGKDRFECRKLLIKKLTKNGYIKKVETQKSNINYFEFQICIFSSLILLDIWGFDRELNSSLISSTNGTCFIFVLSFFTIFKLLLTPIILIAFYIFVLPDSFDPIKYFISLLFISIFVFLNVL